MEKIKFGCHDFLNSKPITVPLIAKNLDWLEIVQQPPAKLAQMLKCRALDLSFIPSIEYAGDQNYHLVKGVSISSHKRVKTVLLICKKEMKEVRTIGTDYRSRSSIALLKLLFMERYRRLPSFKPMKPDCESILNENDGALIIGDESFKIKLSNGFNVYDLSSEWYEMTGKPFVHAVLCAHVNHDKQLSNLVKEIFASLMQSKNDIDSIVIKAADQLGIEKETCAEYLTDTIRYNFGEPEFDSLKMFFALAKKYNVIASVPELRFYGE